MLIFQTIHKRSLFNNVSVLSLQLNERSLNLIATESILQQPTINCTMLVVHWWMAYNNHLSRQNDINIYLICIRWSNSNYITKNWRYVIFWCL